MRFYYIAVVVAAIISAVIAIPAQHSVSIVNFTVVPSQLSINAGDTVVWTNNDGTLHTVTADSQQGGDAFDSGNIVSGQTFSATFSAASTVPYHCTIHPTMKGTITVLLAASSSSRLDIVSPSIILLSIATSFLLMTLF